MKGITPVVSVVLLITLSVISAMGVYWWMAGRVSTPNTPETFATISAEMVSPCSSSGNSTVIIINTSPPGKTIKANSLSTDWSGGLAANSSVPTGTCPAYKLDGTNLVAKCVIVNFRSGNGTITLYGKNIAPQPVAC